MLRLSILLLSAVLLASSCVYFNTYYNARKYFRQAERARNRQERDAVARPGARRRSGRMGGSADELYEQAIRKASKVLEQFPESELVDDAAFLMGRAYYWQRNYQYALDMFGELRDKFPDSEFFGRARYWRALCYQAQGDPQAKEEFRALFAAGEGEIAYQSGCKLAEMAFDAEEYAVAVQEYQAVLDAFPGGKRRAELYLRLGQSLFALGDSTRYDEVLAHFAAVGRESPDAGVEYQARLAIGRARYSRGDIEGALATYSALLEESRFRPFEGETRLAIGQYYQDRHLMDEAVEQYEQVRDDFPQSDDSAMALYRTGMLYLREFGETERAQEYFAETSKEKSGSEASTLARETLKHLSEVDRLLARIHEADSLATLQRAAADSAAAMAPAGGAAGALGSGNEPPAAAAATDSLGTDSPGGGPAAIQSSADSAAVTAAPGPPAGAPTGQDQMPTTPPAADSLGAGVAEKVAQGAGEVGADSSSVAPSSARPAAGPAGDAAASPAAAVADSLEEVPASGEEGSADSTLSTTPAAAPGQDREQSDGGPPWFFEPDAEPGEVSPDDRLQREVLDKLFTVAEIYRSKVALPDSAIHYYEEIVRRFPDSDQLPRALYAMAWIHLELDGDLEAARPHLEQLIGSYPASEQANAARLHLDEGVRTTAEDLAKVEFLRLERLWLQDGGALDNYVPLLDSLSRQFPATHTGAQAAFLAGWTIENSGEDALAAEARYQRLVEDFPSSRFADLVRQRYESRRAGTLDKLERGLRSVGGGLTAAERIRVIAVEPDSVDSVALAQKHFRLGLRAYGRGKFKEAREQCELSLEQQERNPDALYYLGNVSWEEGYPEDAVDYYHQVLGFDGNHLGTHYRLFAAYTAQGMPDSANHYLRELVARDGRNRQVQFVVEEHPDLRERGADRDDLDLDVLETLELPPPEDGLVDRHRELRLAELPLVRKVGLPEYPAGASGDSAEVILDILVDREGRPETVEVFAGDSPFVGAARAAAQDYTFYPALKRKDENVRVWVELALPVSPPGGQTLPPPAGEESDLEEPTEAAPEDTLSSRPDPVDAEMGSAAQPE